jgi:hypothetical protein
MKMGEELDKIIKEINENALKAREQQVILDLFGIFCGFYKNYDDYMKKRRIQTINQIEMNKKENCYVKFTTEITLNRAAFEFALSLKNGGLY